MTPDEIRAHIGEMLRLAIQHGYGDGINPRGWVKVAKAYKDNAGYGTLAERKEAMKAWVEWVYEHGYGMDPLERHAFINHYVEHEQPGEGGDY